MSALHLKIVALCCLPFTMLTGAEKTGVVWKNVGEDITIQCRSSNDEMFLNLWRGLNNEVRLFYTEKSNKNTFGQEIRGRSQTNGAFPNVDILIKNLSLKDTGPYLCEYSKLKANGSPVTKIGEGSVLLVVTGNLKEECEPSNNDLALVSVGIAGAVLLVVIMIFIVWVILKTRSSSTTGKKRHPATNDVYEDMRGTSTR